MASIMYVHCKVYNIQLYKYARKSIMKVICKLLETDNSHEKVVMWIRMYEKRIRFSDP